MKNFRKLWNCHFCKKSRNRSQKTDFEYLCLSNNVLMGSFVNWFFKAFLLNWFKNLRAQFGLYQKRAGIQTPWNPPLDVSLYSKTHVIQKPLQCHDVAERLTFFKTDVFFSGFFPNYWNKINAITSLKNSGSLCI